MEAPAETSHAGHARVVEPAPVVPAVPETPTLAFRVGSTVTLLSALFLMIPVSLFSGYVTGGIVIVGGELVARQLGSSQPLCWQQFFTNFGILSGFVSGGLTFLYFALQFDQAFHQARMRGSLDLRLTENCPNCRASLALGQVLCQQCGKDLRAATGATRPSLALRRTALQSHILGTVPLANGIFAVAVVVARLCLDVPRFISMEAQNAVMCLVGLAAAGLVVAVRIPRALVLWKLLNAEALEVGETAAKAAPTVSN